MSRIPCKQKNTFIPFFSNKEPEISKYIQSRPGLNPFRCPLNDQSPEHGLDPDPAIVKQFRSRPRGLWIIKEPSYAQKEENAKELKACKGKSTKL